MEGPSSWDWGHQELPKSYTYPSTEMNPVLNYNKGRAQSNLNSEMKYEVIFVPSQERIPESSGSNLDKTAKENEERQVLLNKPVLGGQG